MPIKSLSLALACLPLAACVQTTPRWDAQFGQSVRAAVASQVLHPDAAANRDPVSGVDGAAAQGAQKRYERSFAQPEAHALPVLINAAGR